MTTNSPFKVYNASAGSGKTFTLVKEYLKILFLATSNYQFKHILAVTFTNKAVAEMKARILDTLKSFSNPEILKATIKPSMFLAIAKELNIKEEDIQKKSKNILNTIMHNYAAFDISTIDGFNHRLIRTFAHDLKLPINFEVELDTKTMLAQAVDRLIAKAGTNEKLTKILVDFAIEKADDDKSWDVARDFNTIAELLVKESDIKYLKTLNEKDLDDFIVLKKLLNKDIILAKKLIIKTANEVIDLIKEKSLVFSDFTRSTLPNHFIKASKLDFARLYENKLESNLTERKNIYNKNADKAGVIDSILPQIESRFHITKKAVFHLKFLKAIAKNMTPLSVLKFINQELTAIKAEENKMLISEFNAIISQEISNQPTPFIYERMGEKFKHYFIDEFQDTSLMQWQNVIPLIENTLSGENIKAEKGTAMLVGDAKQAIYRWRGGKAEQFMDLFNNKTNPFHTIQQVKNLDANYRSFEAIVNFNNAFFNHVSNTAFSNNAYSNLYAGGHQEPSKKEAGYVNLNFIDFEAVVDKNEVYSQQVLETIQSCQKNGYALKDICILVRKKKHGIAIAQFLSAKDIKITSTETMLINSAAEVQLINNVLTLFNNPNDSECKIQILDFIANKYSVNDKHDFFTKHVHLDVQSFFESFKAFGIIINPKTLVQEALFDIAETIARNFKLVEHSNAYVQFYLDTVLEYSQKNISDITSFLEYYNSKKETLSIVSPPEQEAVQIMTIHKSKGLEFPVVIFPYAEINIYENIEPKEWVDLNPEHNNGFSYTLLNYSKDFENFNEGCNTIHIRHQAELELDSINLLYVAITRPVEQLYVIGKKEINKKGVLNKKSYSGLLINFLMETGKWNNSTLNYSYGSQKRSVLEEELVTIETIEQTEFISTAKADHNIKIIANSGYLWDTNQAEAIEKGNLVHDIMEQIKTESDIDFAINEFLVSAIINEAQAKQLQVSISKIINHPELNFYFSNNHTIYNERDIISKTGKIFRPDRLVINDRREVAIIDYKTGLHNPKYQHQLQDYQDVLEEMNFSVSKKILVYINKDINVKIYD